MNKPAETDRERLRRQLLREAGSLPASSGQRRLWLVDRLGVRAGAYNVFQAVRLRGDLDTAAFERAFTEVVRRHDALRTTFSAVDGEPVQVVGGADSQVLAQTDLSGLAAGDKQAALNAAVRDELGHAFDLSRGPLLRARLLVLGGSDRVLLLNMHHIIADGWSLEVLFADLGAAYCALRAGAGSPLARSGPQYGDFASWERDWLHEPRIADDIGYWKKRLNGLATLQMPIDRPRPGEQSYAGAQLTRDLPAELACGLRALGQRIGTTLFMTLLSGYVVLLRHYAQQQEVVVGSPVANRPRREFERVVGFFVNNLVLRTQVRGTDTISDVLAQVREVCVNAFAHKDLPFERLVEELQPERDLSRNPLFQVAFALQRDVMEALQLGRAAGVPLPGGRDDHAPGHRMPRDRIAPGADHAPGV